MRRVWLEQAARAAGIPGSYHEEWDAIVRTDEQDSFNRGVLWRPHADDAQSFRLAITLGIEPGQALADQRYQDDVVDLLREDVMAASRLAILRVAATRASATSG